MSSNKSVNPLHIKLIPSRLLLVILCLLFAGAVTLPWLLEIALLLKAGITMVVVASFVVSLLKQGWLTGVESRLGIASRFINGLVYTADGEWQLTYGDGRMLEAELSASTTVHPKLATLNFNLRDQPRFRTRSSLVILPDALSVEDFRRLRVLLLSQIQAEVI